MSLKKIILLNQKTEKIGFNDLLIIKDFFSDYAFEKKFALVKPRLFSTEMTSFENIDLSESGSKEKFIDVVLGTSNNYVKNSAFYTIPILQSDDFFNKSVSREELYEKLGFASSRVFVNTKSSLPNIFSVNNMGEYSIIKSFSSIYLDNLKLNSAQLDLISNLANSLNY